MKQEQNQAKTDAEMARKHWQDRLDRFRNDGSCENDLLNALLSRARLEAALAVALGEYEATCHQIRALADRFDFVSDTADADSDNVKARHLIIHMAEYGMGRAARSSRHLLRPMPSTG
jgi:hypothetical protein